MNLSGCDDIINPIKLMIFKKLKLSHTDKINKMLVKNLSICKKLSHDLENFQTNIESSISRKNRTKDILKNKIKSIKSKKLSLYKNKINTIYNNKENLKNKCQINKSTMYSKNFSLNDSNNSYYRARSTCRDSYDFSHIIRRNTSNLILNNFNNYNLNISRKKNGNIIYNNNHDYLFYKKSECKMNYKLKKFFKDMSNKKITKNQNNNENKIYNYKTLLKIKINKNLNLTQSQSKLLYKTQLKKIVTKNKIKNKINNNSISDKINEEEMNKEIDIKKLKNK